jgi:asparagine synthase (glutamine-hydrolysing)
MEHQAEEAQRAFERDPDPVQCELTHALASGPNVVLPLAQTDRLAASLGAEYRHPFFDVRLIELLLAFPHAQRFGGGISKHVLRRAMTGALPELVRERRHETHFTTYIRRCVFEEQNLAVRGLLEGGLLAGRGVLDEAEVRRLLSDPGSDSVVSLWSALALELWLRQSFNVGSAAAVPSMR